MFEIELNNMIKQNPDVSNEDIKNYIKEKVSRFARFNVEFDEEDSFMIKGEITSKDLWVLKKFEANVYLRNVNDLIDIDVDIAPQFSEIVWVGIIIGILSGGVILAIVLLLLFVEWNKIKQLFKGVMKSLKSKYS
ncbi:MAG: hypothetical protein C0601_10660 [Candidatus Muiribacterium halophilum]|uniref:Uncharacterized protein n=1 Tax=Muiribacterium halophilum TaxID=2053465 RepID=A0A2N5ZC59_MUIH1|nr:MAG: hypothetical protein C0601_10660 [Candidatus Muirbacterium halophilum]